MTRRRFLRGAGLALLALAALRVAPAAAQERLLDEARAAGTVGERYDGYAVVRGSGPAGLVAEINAKRKEVYEARAKKENVAADQVGRVYAKQIFGKAPKGTWFLQENGQWVQK